VPRLDDLAKAALPWSDNMGPNLQDAASGVFFGAFALFAAPTASSCPAPSSSAFA
jgi:ammonium transporter, Amt family